jgi:hypothetical protein|tara:strand:- start:30 stop:215 length:186 start_codon:yes stop_codon:yes gene_type:complete
MMNKFLWFYRLSLLAILGMLGYDVINQNVTGFTFAYPFLLLYFYWRMGQMEAMVEKTSDKE